MTNTFPYDDYNGIIHRGGAALGSLTPQWGNTTLRNGWKLILEFT